MPLPYGYQAMSTWEGVGHNAGAKACLAPITVHISLRLYPASNHSLELLGPVGQAMLAHSPGL